MENNNANELANSSTYDDASETATNILENLKPNKSNDDKKEEEKTLSEEEEDDQFSEDLYTAINYNTINSLAALKEILGTGDTENIVDSSWFQYHFLRHVNRLPSRSNYASAWSPWEGNRRRLSECKEEDEDAEDKEEEKKKSTDDLKSETSNAKSYGISRTPPQTPKTPPSVTPMTPSTPSSRPTTPTGFAAPLRRRFASVGNVGRESPGPLIPGLPQYGSMEPVGNWYSTSRTSPLHSPHLDKRFFDCSLIEMKSQASSSSTIDYDSMDEVWVKRNDTSITPETVRRKKELGSQPLPVIAVEEHMTTGGEPQMRPRAGTWSMPSRSRRQKTSSTSSQPDSNSSSGRATPTATSGRRKSGDDILTNVSPSRKAQALFDAFRPRSKSDASKAKKPSNIISQMKNAMHRASGSSQSSQSRSSSIDGSSEEKERDKHHSRPRAGSEAKDKSRTMSDGKEKHPQRPRAGSDSGKGTVSKVMDLFRYRSHSAVSAEDKRKANSIDLSVVIEMLGLLVCCVIDHHLMITMAPMPLGAMDELNSEL
ncbi:hypothetical protein RUM44_001599 [Polyplax serrata]|uniref:Uncharacterized protein n=1 Tax=Polyplax serrata TaxID=468196 RepID=A0ABR1AKG9_POLSC